MIEIPGYNIRREVGQGGMASVYLAVQASLEREVALKVMANALAADPAFTRRFLQEARMLASLAHPNIVQVFDVGVTGNQMHYFAMQYLPGGDFIARVQRGLDEAELKRVLVGVAQALGYAHQRGYVHRDVAPGNILFDNNDNPVLTDFGIALAATSGTRITSTGFSVGTSHYMSPEQARGGDVDSRSDLYSLGVLTWFGLTGKPPYDGADGFAVAYAHVFEPVPELPADKAHWQPLIARALAKDPKDRYADVGQFVEALEEIVLPVAAAPVKDGNGAAKTVVISTKGNESASARALAAASARTPRPSAPAPPVPAAARRDNAKPVTSPLTPKPIGDGGGKRWTWLVVAAIALLGLLGVLYVFLKPAGLATRRPTTTQTQPPAQPETTTKPPVAVTTPPPVAPKVDPTPTPPVATPPIESKPIESTPPVTPPADVPTPTEPAAGDLVPPEEQVEVATVVDPVQALVRLGRIDLAAQRYTTPPGANALERFKLALRIDAKDKAAKQGISDTARAYLALAEKALAAKDTATALQHFDRAVEVANTIPEGKPVVDEVAQRRTALAAPFIEEAKRAAALWKKDVAKAAYDQALVFDPGSAAVAEGLKKLPAIGAAGFVFRDTNGPELVVLPGAALAVARREVTRGEFRRYWGAAGAREFGAKEPTCRDRESIFRSSKKRNWQNPDISQDDSHPVVCISWDEAAGYARWLSAETGKRYRLLTVAEWESLARTAPRGDCSTANLADAQFKRSYDKTGADCDDGFAATAPVGHYGLAAAGVYDIDGNVREWVNACGNGAPAAAGCREHLVRGRAWSSTDKEPVTFSDSFSSDIGSNTIGLRVIRDIETP